MHIIYYIMSRDVHHEINEAYGIAETSTNDEDPATAPESYVVFRT